MYRCIQARYFRFKGIDATILFYEFHETLNEINLIEFLQITSENRLCHGEIDKLCVVHLELVDGATESFPVLLVIRRPYTSC